MKKWHWLTLALITVLSIVAEFNLGHVEGHEHWWSHIPLFYIIFGFLGCVLIVAVAKGLGKLFILKKEGYYNGG